MWTLANPRLQAALVCLGIAIVYVFIWPGRKDPERFRQHPLWRQLVLRWFHSLTWVLIGAACLFWSKLWALAALVAYIIFMLVTLAERNAASRR
jgi:hypothetical protein